MEKLETAWVKILQTLRAEKNFALFGLLSNMDDVVFQDNKIVLRIHNEAEKNVIKNHLAIIQKIAGENVILELQDCINVVEEKNDEYVTRLKELFGDKVEIV